MQKLLKIMTMTLVCGFGAPGGRRKHLKIAKLYFFTLQASPLAALTCLRKIPGDPGRPVQPVGLPVDVKKYKITNFKYFLHLSEAPTPKKNVIFELSMKFCIGRCQNPKINFFPICCTFFAGVRPP